MSGPLQPGTVRARAKAAMREKILATARALFVSHGYDVVTLRTVAHHAGCSTGAIFNSWSDKDELFKEATGRAPITDLTGVQLLAALYEIRRCCENAHKDTLRVEVAGVLDRLGGLL